MARELKTKKLTCVGTVRKNKRFIPKEFLPNRSREIGSNLFGFRNIATLVSHVPKQNKAVLLLSTRHHTATVDADGKSEINKFYNKTKAGVDVLDQLCHAYSTQRSTQRWPFSFFMNLLNVAGVAAFVIFRVMNNIDLEQTDKKRKQFILQMSEELTYDQIKRRATVGLSRETRSIIENVMHDATMPEGVATPEVVDAEPPPAKRRRCYQCPRNIDRKIKQICCICKKNVCNEHSVTTLTCGKCATAHSNTESN